MLNEIRQIIEAEKYFSKEEITEAKRNGLSLYGLSCLYFRQEKPGSKVVKEKNKVIVYVGK